MNCKKCHKPIPESSAFCNWCGTAQETKRQKRLHGNGLGTVYKRGRTWTAKVILSWRAEDGRLLPISATKGGFATKREATDYLPALRGDKQERKTLAEYWDIWERDNLPKLSTSKQTAYKIAYRKLGNLVHRDIAKLDISDLRTAVAESATSYYTARDIKTLLMHLYKLAGADQVANGALPSYIVLPDKQETEQTPFSNDELVQLWTAYSDGDTFVGYILLMIYSGMMPGELLGARKAMVDLDGQRIIGAGIKTHERKKSDIVIADFMVPVVASLLEYSTGVKLITMNKDNFYIAYYDALERCHCRRLPPYSCRHTTATALAIGNNIAPSIIRKVMRWSTTRMLDRYAHATSSDALEAVNVLAPTINKLSTDADQTP